MEEMLVGGGSVGGIGIIAVAAWRYLNTKKNGNGTKETVDRIDRWTISHDAQTEKMVGLTTQQVEMTKEMRDAILIMADRRKSER